MHNRPRKKKILRQKIREFKIPVERNLLTFVRTNAKASSAKENNGVKKLQ